MKESTGKVSLFQRSPSVEQDNRWKNGSWLQAKRFLLFFLSCCCYGSRISSYTPAVCEEPIYKHSINPVVCAPAERETLRVELINRGII